MNTWIGFVLNLRNLISSDTACGEIARQELYSLLLESTKHIPQEKPRFAFGVTSIGKIVVVVVIIITLNYRTNDY